MAMKRHRITIVGCGPGNTDHLTAIARREIDDAEVLAGAPRLIEGFPHSKVQRIPVRANIAQALDRIAACRGKRVVVLVTGDPGLCSLAQPVIRRFGRAACRVIPGISAIQAAFAAVGVDWTDARIITAHHRLPDIQVDTLASAAKIAVLAGNQAALPWLTQLAGVMGKSFRIFVCQDLTLPEESVRCVPATKLHTMKLSSRAVILFIRKEELK